MPEWPFRVSNSLPVSASHTFAVPSTLAVARRLPSGLKATPCNGFRVAAQGEQFLAGLRVPHLRRLVLAGGGEALAIGAEGHTHDRCRVAA